MSKMKLLTDFVRYEVGKMSHFLFLQCFKFNKSLFWFTILQYVQIFKIHKEIFGAIELFMIPIQISNSE